MRVKIYKNGGNPTNTIAVTGGSVDGAVVLNGDPTSPLMAANKGYTDAIKSNLNAVNAITGILSIARLPSLGGDILAQEGTNVMTLKNTGVVPGTYTKVTVNNKGLVTAGSSIVSDDIPNVDWSKITTGKPTTLAGYGITDALPSTGGTMLGALKTTAEPTDGSHVLNRSYVDALTAGGSEIPTGLVVRKFTEITPTGFLRANGAILDKVTYADLYAVIGDAFSIQTTPGSGKPWKLQYDINTEQSANITGWTTGTNLPTLLRSSQVIVTKNRVYLLGGVVGGSASAVVHTAPINTDGTLGTWTTGTSLPAVVHQSQAIVTKNRVYLLGGFVNGSENSAVHTAPINTDGTLGTWTTGTSLPTTVYQSQAIVTKNRVYLLGGVVGGSASAVVHTAPINTDGTLGTWTTGTSLPVAVTQSQAIVTKNRVYLLGGVVNSSASVIVHTAPINTDGTLGTWTTGTSLPTTVYQSQAIVTKNRVYLLSGAGGNVVYTTPINTDGTLGTWTTGTGLPAIVHQSQAIVTKNRVYFLGGFVNGSESSAVHTAPILGGLNDYSPYYDGTVVPVDPNSFAIPDYSNSELPGTFSYIKA